MQEEFLILFAVIGGAAAVPFISRRLGMPSSVLEIVYGIALFNLAVDHLPDWFVLLKELGFIYLMFIAGMELDVRQLWKSGRLCWYVLIPALSLTIMPLAMVMMGYSFFLGIAVSVLSAGIIIPVLKEAELLHTDWGRDVIGIALTGELLSILVLTGADVYHSHGLTLMALFAGLKLVLLLAMATISLRVLYVLAWWNPERVERVMESEDPVEEGIRAVVAIAFAGALLAYGAGVEPILGSFMAGVIFSFVFKSKGRFEEKINAVGFGFFIPFFFIGIGASFNVLLLTSTDALLLALFLTLLVFLSNIFPLFFSRWMRMGTRDALSMTLILSAPLSLMVVAGTLGEKMGLLTPRSAGSLILTAILSGILFPYLFRLTAKGLAIRVKKPDAADKHRAASSRN